MKLIFITWTTLFLLIPATLFAQITARSTPEEIVTTIKNRSSVINTFEYDTALQISLPPQYPLCLFLISQQSRTNNDVSNELLLSQIDFLNQAGLKSADIRSLISYGHAILVSAYAKNADQKLNDIMLDDLPAIEKYGNAVFKQVNCETFNDNKTKNGMRELIQEIDVKFKH